MAAAGVTLRIDDREQIVTTSDAALTIVRCTRDIRRVTVQMTSAAGGYIQTEGAVQDAAVGTAVIELSASGAASGEDAITPSKCGVSGWVDWSFGVARSAAGAVFRLRGEV